MRTLQGSLKNKLLAMVMVPILVVAILSGLKIHDEWSSLNETKRLHAMADLFPPLGELVHQLQKERALSVMFTSSQGAESERNQLTAQRQETDKALQSWQKALELTPITRFGGDFESNLNAMNQALMDLPTHRSRVESLALAPAEVAAYFIQTIAKGHKGMGAATGLSTNITLTRSILALLNLAQIKELSGQERALGAGAFAKGAFTLTEYQKLLTLLAYQQEKGESYRLFATPLQQKALTDLETSEPAQMLKGFEASALQSLETQSLSGITAQQWVATATAKINLAHQLETELVSYLSTTMSAAESASRFQLLVWSCLGLGVIGITLWLTLRSTGRVVRPVLLLAGEFRKLSDYDLTVRVPVTSRDEIGTMSGLFNELVDRLRGIVGNVRQSSQQVVAAAEEMSSSMQTISEMANVQKTAIEQVTLAVANSTEASTQISHLATRTQGSVTEITQSTRRAEEVMTTLRKNSEEIVAVTDIIREISNQINLLALNAAIEAARAGDAGRGFAVVADEVRALANNAASSTEQIGRVIGSLQQNILQTGDAMAGITLGMGNISQNVTHVTEAIAQQTAALEEISVTMQEVSKQIDHVSGSVEEANLASNSVARESVQLDTQVSGFKM